MISFRYHVVSLVAVLLALAVGVLLGSGPLQREGTDLQAQVEEAQAASAAYEQQLAERDAALAFDDAFAAVAGPTLVARRLAQRPVTLVLLPGVQDTAVTSVVRLVGAAGGRVTGSVEVEPDLLDVGNRQLVEELARQLERSSPRVQVPAEAGPYEQVGTLLAYAVGSKQQRGAAVDPVGESILSGLSTANLVSTGGSLTRRGSLVLVLAGPPEEDPEQQQATASIVTGLAEALDRGTGGVVVAGPPETAVETGVVGAVRADPGAVRSVSTVDVLDRTAGAVATVLAAAEQAGGRVGHYGAVEAPGGALPGAAP